MLFVCKSFLPITFHSDRVFDLRLMESAKSNNSSLLKTPTKKPSSFIPPSPSKSSDGCATTIDLSPSSPLIKLEKRNPPPPRMRNHNVALSIKDVRRTAAQMTRKSNLNRSEENDKSSSKIDLGHSRDRFLEKLGKSNGGGSVAVEGGEKSIELPERYDMLCKFFDAMDSSIRLLKCRRLASTFTNVCSQVEALTDRRFTVGHLAQLKHILPEAIVLKRTLVQDKETGCMKDDLLIMLDGNSIKSDENADDVSRCRNLREAFRVRVKNFCKSHSEDVDVPEASIPELRSLKRNDLSISIDKKSKVASTSHVPQSFKKRFSQKFSLLKVEETTANIEDSPAVAARPNEDPVFEEVVVSSQPLKAPATPCKKEIESLESNYLSLEGSASIDGTPAKFVLTPGKLIAATPAQKPEKRPNMSPIDDACSKLVRRPHRSRSLKFDPPEETDAVDDQVSQVDGSSVDRDVLDILPESLLQSVREKERRILEEQDPAISQAKRRQQLIAGLPKLFDIVRLLFQSINRSVITKEELLYRVTIGHADIVDKGEIEEQLKLLLELAPEYLTEKSCLSGSTLLRLNKTSSADSVRAKLLEAN